MSHAPPSFPFSPFPWFFSPLTAPSSSSLVHRKAMALELHPRPSPSARPRSILPMQPATSSSSFVAPVPASAGTPASSRARGAPRAPRPRRQVVAQGPVLATLRRPRPSRVAGTPRRSLAPARRLLLNLSVFLLCNEPERSSRSSASTPRPWPQLVAGSVSSRRPRRAPPGLLAPRRPPPPLHHAGAPDLFVAMFPCFCVRGGRPAPSPAAPVDRVVASRSGPASALSTDLGLSPW